MVNNLLIEHDIGSLLMKLDPVVLSSLLQFHSFCGLFHEQSSDEVSEVLGKTRREHQLDCLDFSVGLFVRVGFKRRVTST